MENLTALLQREEIYHQTLKELISELVQLIKSKHVIVNEDFIVLMIKICSLDPHHKFLVRQPIERMEIERLKKIVVERVMSMTDATRNLIRMQLYYKANYFTRLEIVKARRLDLENKIRKSLTEMIKSIPKHQRHYDTYYEKLLTTIIIKSGMGSYSEFRVLKETKAALETIFPKDDINLLTTMTIKGREQELRLLMKMSSGIRLFNYNLDPANLGAGIIDLPSLIPTHIKTKLKHLTEIRERNIRRLIVYTTLTKGYFLDESQINNDRKEYSSNMIFIRHGLVMIHQLLIYIKELADDLAIEQKLCTNLIQAFYTSLTDLKETLKDANVATFITYPKYIELSNGWEKLQDSIVYIESFELLIKSLEKFSEDNLKEIDPPVLDMADLNQIPTEQEFFDYPEYILTDDPLAIVIRQEFNFNNDPLEMEYSGFCLWSLVQGYGMIILSNPNIGVYTYKGRSYLFSTPEGAAEFSRTPDKFIYKAIQIARRWPQLIYLLKMDKDIFNLQFVQEADKSTALIEMKISTDSSIQTEPHPIDSNIVQGYTWNEWELRKQAIILSMIHKCKTHSTQTHWQALKKTQEVQTYSSRNRKIQTNQHKYVEAPRNQFYFHGLRGLQRHPPHIVELTRESVEDLRSFTKTKEQIEHESLVKRRDSNLLTLFDFKIDEKRWEK